MNRTFLTHARRIATTGVGAPLLLMIALAMMVVPLPPLMLDALFTFNISLSLVVLMAAIYSRRPLDFGAFPSVLLVATLLRLALNVASTRVVLLNGHTGGAAAGHVIEAFGSFVIGGNYAVGLVVFAILVIINFVVVTKGAGRISEVSARFTLDAMPGKQMAIDADLNAGLITQDEARTRRAEVAGEADFYGAMDGAGKFVRGDAIAGILILFINIIGGLAIGMAQHGLAFGDALQVYALLTIGDGLVAQIPSLLLSTAAALMVTRVSSEEEFGHQILGQLFSNPRTLWVTCGVVGIIGLIPGMPNLAFLTLAVIAGGGARLVERRAKLAREERQAAVPEVAPAAETRELSWDDVEPVDPLGLEVGYRLIPLVDKSQGGELMGRIKGVRKKVSKELGFLIPAVHIRDNLELAPTGYHLSVMGVTVGESEVYPERELAINPGEVYGELPGEAVKDPVFGLEALWIDPVERDQAQSAGYTVVDASTVIATHISQILTDNAHLLLGYQEAQQLLDRLAQSYPKLVENLVPKVLPLGVMVKVLRNLLRERVPLRDLRTIVETLSEHGVKSQDADALTAVVRRGLGRFITQNIKGLQDELPVISLDPTLDQILHQAVQSNGDVPVIEPGLADSLQQQVAHAARRQELVGEPAVLLVSDTLRGLLASFFRHSVPGLHVLAFGELPDNRQIRIVATAGRQGELAAVASS